jgi:putative transposase
LAAQRPLLALIWADTAFRGLIGWCAMALGWKLFIVKHCRTRLQGVWVAPGQPPLETSRGFHVLPRLWVVERTLAWIGRNRHMAKDCEHLVQSGKKPIYADKSCVMLRRLAETAT